MEGIIESNDNKDFFSQSFKGGLYAFILATVLVLILALIVKLFNIGTNALPIVNEVFKVLSVAIGTFIAVKPNKGLLKGMVAGVIFVIMSTALFALLGGDFKWAQLGIDFLASILTGGIFGAIANSRKS